MKCPEQANSGTENRLWLPRADGGEDGEAGMTFLNKPLIEHFNVPGIILGTLPTQAAVLTFLQGQYPHLTEK